MTQIFPMIALQVTDGTTTVNANTLTFNGFTVSDNGTIEITLPSISSTRASYPGTTASIADLASDDITISAADHLLIGRIETDVAATVRLYSLIAARTADAGRPLGDPVPPNLEGFIAEIQLTAGNLIFDNNAAIAFINMEAAQASDIYAKVFNESGGMTTVTVTLSANDGLVSGARTTYAGATSSIADLSSEDIVIFAEKSLLLGRVSTDVEATVRIYNSLGAQAADSGRPLGDPIPLDIEGLVAEIQLTTGNLDYDLSSAIAFINMEPTQTPEVFVTAFNESGGNSVVTVTLHANPCTDTTRSVHKETTTSIADLASEDINISAHNVLAIGQVSTDFPATVRLYSTDASRTADAGRGLGDPIPPNIEGLVAEVQLTTGNLDFNFSPAIPFINMEGVQTDEIFATVFNESGGNAAIEVSITSNFGE